MGAAVQPRPRLPAAADGTPQAWPHPMPRPGPASGQHSWASFLLLVLQGARQPRPLKSGRTPRGPGARSGPTCAPAAASRPAWAAHGCSPQGQSRPRTLWPSVLPHGTEGGRAVMSEDSPRPRAQGKGPLLGHLGGQRRAGALWAGEDTVVLRPVGTRRPCTPAQANSPLQVLGGGGRLLSEALQPQAQCCSPFLGADPRGTRVPEHSACARAARSAQGA